MEPSRERILDVAIELFARYGVEGVSLSLLADHVGLHKSTLFHHFRGKAELASAALRRAVEPLCERVEALPASGPRELEQLVAVMLALDDHFAAQPAAARFLLRALLGPSDSLDEDPELERPEHPVSRIFTALGGWLDAARSQGVVRPLRVRLTVVDLLALGLLHPALASEAGGALSEGPADTRRARRARREELARHLRAALAPDD